MWYIRVCLGPQSLSPGAMIGRYGVTGFVRGGGLRTQNVSTLGWAILFPGSDTDPYAIDWQGKRYMRYDAEIRLAQIAQAGSYHSATYIYVDKLEDIR